MKYQNILIPLDEKPATMEIVEFVCSIQAVIQAEIHVAYFLEVPRNLPLNVEMPEKVAKAKAILARAEAFAVKYQTNIITSVVYARTTEDTIVATAADLKCDLIALAHDVQRVRFFANNAVVNVLQRAKCNVWVFHQKQLK